MSDILLNTVSEPSLSVVEVKNASISLEESSDDTNCQEKCISQKESSDDGESAPIELLSEFLSAVMSRDYEEALHYCKKILYYEPENEIVQEFYPLIEARLKEEKDSGELESEETSSDETDLEDDESSTTSTSDFQDTQLIEDFNKSTSSDDANGWTTALNTDSDSTEKDENDDNSNPCGIANCLFQTTDSNDICDNKVFTVST